MTSIGNRETALMLHQHYGGDMDSSRRAPHGFKRVGRGCYRMAVVDKANNVVYKIGDYGANVAESANSRRLGSKSMRNIGFDLVIPRTRTYRMPRLGGYQPYWYSGKECVIAQEFAPDARGTYCAAQDDWRAVTPNCNCKGRSISICFAKVHQTIIEWSGLEDIHGNNILMDRSGKFWLIDMAD